MHLYTLIAIVVWLLWGRKKKDATGDVDFEDPTVDGVQGGDYYKSSTPGDLS